MVAILEFSQNDEVGELAAGAAPRAPRPASAACASARSSSASSARPRQPHRRDVGRLALLRVLAGGLAERRGAAVVVEHVVDHLEGEADRLGVPVQLCRRRRPSRCRRQRPSSTAARISAPVLWMCMNSSSGSARAPCRSPRGRSPGRPPCRASRRRRASSRHHLELRARHRPRAGARESSWKASDCSASPTSSAVASSYSTCTVGLPRRRTSSSMQGRSSCTSE